jgi:hypothetical protein
VADQAFELDALHDLLEEGMAVAQLAKDEKQFLGVYQAFRAGNRQAFEEELRRLGLLGRCRLVCEWIRSKECVFLCLELCGPPPAEAKPPDPRQVVEAAIRVTSDPKLLKQLVAAVEKRDKAAFQRIVAAEKLQPFCHLFCHWVCTVHYRLVCRWLCGPIGPRPNLAEELRAAGLGLRALLGEPQAFQAAVAASQAGDAAKLGATLRAPELYRFCIYLCEWFCSWRCVFACLTICRTFPLKLPENEPVEAYEFAKQTATLAQHPLNLERLSAAVGAGDAATFGRLVTELKLQAYCLQLCHWICRLRCRLFCVRVCPPLIYTPLFTHVGDFDIDHDFDANGLTNKARLGHNGVLHGGPGFGFAGVLPLRGFCPRTSPIDSSETMQYRFLFVQGGGAPTPIQGGFVTPTGIYAGFRWILWNGLFKRQDVYIRGVNPTADPPPPSPDPDPPDQFIVPDANGWISIPAETQGDAFSDTLLGFASESVVAGGTPPPAVAPGPGQPAAGQAVGTPENGGDLEIVFQATRASTVAAVNGGAAPDYQNMLAKIHVNNWAEVHQLDLGQFYGPGASGCSPLTTDLDILYTVDHELIRDWSIGLSTASGQTLGPPPPPPPPGTARGGNGDYHQNVSGWPTCSYAVTLTTQRKITDGVDDASAWTSQVTFCIGARRLPPH